MTLRWLLPLAVLSAALGMSLPAQADWARFDSVREAVGDATPNTEGLNLELPLVSEDGSAVPMTVSIDSPMSTDDYIESIQVFAEGNPNDEVVDFILTPLVGRAEVASRIRVNESQTIWAVARSSQGEVWVASHDIRVTVGGCLMTADDLSSVALSQPRVAVPASFEPGMPGEVRTLVTHPMETGLREGPSGDILPRRLVDTLTVTVGGDTALTVRMHTAVSANPYVRFFLAPAESAEASFVWQEDSGVTVSEQVGLEVGG